MKDSFKTKYNNSSFLNSSFKKVVSKNITSTNLIDLYLKLFNTLESNNFFIISNQSGGIHVK